MGTFGISFFSADQVNSLVCFFNGFLVLAISSFSFGLLSIINLGQNSLVIVMKFSQLSGVDFWPLDNFYFSYSDVLDRVDGIDFLGDLLLDDFGSEQVEDLGGSGFGDFLGDDFVHAASDFLLLGAQCIVGLLLLVMRFPSEGNGENCDDISIGRSAILNTFNKGFAFLNEGTKLVTSHVNTIEAAQSISSSGLINDQTNFSPGEVILIGSEVSLATGDDSASDAILDFL